MIKNYKIVLHTFNYNFRDNISKIISHDYLIFELWNRHIPFCRQCELSSLANPLPFSSRDTVHLFPFISFSFRSFYLFFIFSTSLSCFKIHRFTLSSYSSGEGYISLAFSPSKRNFYSFLLVYFNFISCISLCLISLLFENGSLCCCLNVVLVNVRLLSFALQLFGKMLEICLSWEPCVSHYSHDF
jgi:hypothetical protein